MKLMLFNILQTIIKECEYIYSHVTYIVGTDRKYWFLLDSIAAAAGVVTATVQGFIWEPAITYYVVILLVVVDFLTGVSVAIKANNVETRKAMRLVYKILAYTLIMVVAHNIGRSEPALFWLPQAVVTPIVLILLMSTIKNLSLLNVLPAHVAKFLYNSLDKYKNAYVDKVTNSLSENDVKKPAVEENNPKPANNDQLTLFN